MRPYVLVMEEEACVGCKACEVACKQENGVPDGIQYIRVWEDGPKAAEGRLTFVFRTRVCRHCDDPPCLAACSAEAISRRDDGVVVLDPESCIGCGLCVDACPFGAIAFDAERGIASKCNLCYKRIDGGLLPACADNVCPAHCIYFGPPEEVEARIRAKRAKRAVR